MHPDLPGVLREFIAETVASAPPVSDQVRADLQMIVWGSAPAAPAGPAEAA
jgi:hypothetical protein